MVMDQTSVNVKKVDVSSTFIENHKKINKKKDYSK